jgi:DNA-binding response OmpR family regulator
VAPLHVLIIDNDLRACELLRDHLTRVAPETRVLAELHSAAAAEQRLAQHDYDIVFLDVQPPVGNGFDLVPFVRAEAAISLLRRAMTTRCWRSR